MLIGWLRPHYEEDDGKGGGGDGKVRASELRAQLGAAVDEQALMRVLEKQSDLLNDNHRLREQRTALKRELADAQGKMPGEGGRVLSADEAKVYDAYVALGKPEEVKRTIEASSTATAELATLRRAETIRAAAEAHGYRATALGKLPSLAGKDVLLKDGQDAEGKPIKQAFVKDGATETALPDYIQANDPEFLGALTSEQQQQAQPAGTSYIQQNAGGGKPRPQSAGQAYVQQTKYAVPGK